LNDEKDSYVLVNMNADRILPVNMPAIMQVMDAGIEMPLLGYYIQILL